MSPLVLAELRDVLATPRLRRWISEAAAAEYVDGLTDAAQVVEDPPAQAGLSPDPDDDYLITLARQPPPITWSPAITTSPTLSTHFADTDATRVP